METSSGNEESVQPQSHTVIVSGYPSFTQPQDIERTFSKYGNLTLDSVTDKFATLTFLDEEDAQAAIQDSKKINVYGEFLTVKPMVGNLPNESPQKQTVAQQNQKYVIDPRKIDLSGDFHEQLDNVMAAVRLTKDEVASLGQLYNDLETLLQQLWPDCKTIPFGSITTGLGIKSSDADCFIEVPPAHHGPYANFVHKCRRQLLRQPRQFADVLAIPRASTPIVKFFHLPTRTHCDVTFKTLLGAQNSKLIAFLLQADPRLVPVAVLVKYWAKVHGFSGTGRLTNYALTLMIIFYLQRHPISILPSVHWLQRDPANQLLVDHWNAGFMNQHDQLPRSSNTSSIAELLGGFFEFYAVFNFEEMIVCPYTGYPVKKELFKDINNLPEEFERYKNNMINHLTTSLRFTTSICIQDPIEHCHNVASSISFKMANEIKLYFQFAANAYEKDKLNGCKEFLKIILCEKPILPRGKPKLRHRFHVHPRDVAGIVNEDWKSVVKEIVVKTIFEQMLLLKLSEIRDKKVPKASAKEKYKYAGTFTKAIWKRKNFSRLYFNLGIIKKQKRITEDVIKNEKEDINLQFQLVFTFTNNSKGAQVTVKLLDGDVDMFRDFGRFFSGHVLSWFKALINRYKRLKEVVTPVNDAETIKTLDANLDSSSEDSDEDTSQSTNSVECETGEASPKNLGNRNS